MAWFSVIKGAYPSLQQIDKTLNVGARETDIVRGSVVKTVAGIVGEEFVLAAAADATDPTAYVYFALVGQDDFTAGMAGTIGQGPAGGVARITALAVGMPMEFQTDQYDSGNGTYAVGTLLTVADGGLLGEHSTGDNAVAQVTVAPFERWVNDAVAVPGRRTGARVSVIQARTMWVPTLAL